MNKLNLVDVYQYVEQHIGEFHTKRLDKIDDLKLTQVLLRKNPYLFKAKNILTAEAFVKGIVDAYLSSQEETVFGDFLERIAVFVCGKVFGGYKPEAGKVIGIDLIFDRENWVYVVSIKSGPNWGNSDQINKMILNFQVAVEQLQNQYPGKEIVPVNGCSYGKDANPHKRRKDGSKYWKLCGQDFWWFISGDERLYTDIIEPLGYQAKERNDDFEKAYARVINRFTITFAQEFCTEDGDIDWAKIVDLTSARPDKSPLHQQKKINGQ